MFWALVVMTLLVVCIQRKMMLITWRTTLNCIQNPECLKRNSLLACLPFFLNTAWHMLVYLTSLSSFHWHYRFQTQFLIQNICFLINLSNMKTPQLCIDVATFTLNFSLVIQNVVILNVWRPMLVKLLLFRCFLISSYRIYFKVNGLQEIRACIMPVKLKYLFNIIHRHALSTAITVSFWASAPRRPPERYLWWPSLWWCIRIFLWSLQCVVNSQLWWCTKVQIIEHADLAYSTAHQWIATDFKVL